MRMMILSLAVIPIILAVLAPYVFGRWMDSGPQWLWQTAQLVVVLGGTVVLLSEDKFHEWLGRPDLPRWLMVGAVTAALVPTAIVVYTAFLKSAPRLTVAVVTDGSSRQDSIVAGVPWNDNLSVLDVTIINPSSRFPYRELDVFLTPDEPVLGAKNTGDLED
ncbi:MAG: hypothetical protein WD031_03815, partial [Gemmatimonadota bacterium]